MISLSAGREYATLRNLDESTRQRDRSLQSLASGKRAEISPAEQALSAYLLTQADSLGQALENTQAAENLVQTAQGGLNEVNAQVRDIRRLSVASANTGVYGAEVQQAFQAQIQSSLQSIQNFASQTQFNGQNLLDGTHAAPAATVQFQTGPNAGDTVNTTLGNAQTSSLGTGVVANKSLADIDLNSANGAAEAIQIAEAARVEISQQSARLGALQRNTLRSNGNALQDRISATQEANSRLADTDYGAESTRSVANKILQSAGFSMLGHALNRDRVNALLK
jgi:flagellin